MGLNNPFGKTSMKKALPVLAIVLALGMSTAFDADAKRLGGGRSSGMQRQATPAPATPHTAPNATGQQAAPAATPNNAGAAAAGAAGTPRRSWMGPIAGLAAGLGLAALASHLGFGAGLANMLMIGVLVMAALMVVGFVMRKRAMGEGPNLAGAGAGGRAPGLLRSMQPEQSRDAQPQGGSMIGSAIATPARGSQAMPAGFDSVGFAANAKMQFMALQAANDARDLGRLRDYLTPEMFELVRADLAERGDTPQSTEVFGLDAQVLAVAEEESRYVASVRFTGSVRDQAGAVPEDLDEIWHLTKPRTGLGGWTIAGIQQHAN